MTKKNYNQLSTIKQNVYHKVLQVKLNEKKRENKIFVVFEENIWRKVR